VIGGLGEGVEGRVTGDVQGFPVTIVANNVNELSRLRSPAFLSRATNMLI
jgi:hypothetical protein